MTTQWQPCTGHKAVLLRVRPLPCCTHRARRRAHASWLPPASQAGKRWERAALRASATARRTRASWSTCGCRTSSRAAPRVAASRRPPRRRCQPGRPGRGWSSRLRSRFCFCGACAALCGTGSWRALAGRLGAGTEGRRRRAGRIGGALAQQRRERGRAPRQPQRGPARLGRLPAARARRERRPAPALWAARRCARRPCQGAPSLHHPPNGCASPA